ncbi:hypothetical protein LCGC14_1452770 [marine sediment metagenome]|uniref:Uncharacterized protein n=1 Tax=marine sediment metagenome TaxID=412755 RepID=A0A0F9JI33_9ZZZZ
MVVYSTSKKLRVQRGKIMICFAGGAYYYDKHNQRSLFKILETVSPTESIITDQGNKQINKPKAKKVKESKDEKRFNKVQQKVNQGV